MKTIKIKPLTHKRLIKLKAELDQKSISDLLDAIIYSYCQEHNIQFENYETK